MPMQFMSNRQHPSRCGRQKKEEDFAMLDQQKIDMYIMTNQKYFPEEKLSI